MDITADSHFPPSGTETTGGRLPRVPWGPGDVGVGTLLFILAFLLVPIPFAIPAFIVGDTDSREALVPAILGSVPVYAAIAWIAWRQTIGKYGGGLARLGFRSPTWQTFAWAGAALAGALVISAIYGLIVEQFDIGFLHQDCADQVPESIRQDALILALTSVIAVVLAPPIEEIFFRGFAFRGLLYSWGLPAAVVVSGLMFGSAHLLGNPVLYKSLVQFALIGMVFALVFYYSGNLLSSMIAHFSFNLLGVVAIAASTCDSTGATAIIHRWLAL